MLDGARNALLGYLYQLLGTASVRVRMVAPGDDISAELLMQPTDTHLHCEEFGQDATLRPIATPDRHVTAIQFKHSAKTGSAIERSELIDMLLAFDRSRREAHPEVEIDRYLLITNRTLDVNAHRLLSDGRTSSTPPAPLRLRTLKAGEAIAENVKRLTDYAGDPISAAAAWHAVLQRLEVRTGETFEADLSRLRDFAARYGVLDHEWNRGLNTLIGAFVSETAAGRTINVTREWLKGQLVGDSDAADLRFGTRVVPHISTVCRERLEWQIRHRHRIPNTLYLERQVQQELQAQLEQYPVVFVAGGGGCGKSLAVATYLHSVADRELVWSEAAALASEDDLVRAIIAARLPSGRCGGIDQSLADIRSRLEVANPGRRPLLTLDLDGVDEAPDRYPQLCELIAICWAQGNRDASPASLVVTCRSTTGTGAREQLIREWLNTPVPDLVDGIGFVSIDDFQDHELAEAAQLLGGTGPEQRILQALAVGGVGPTVVPVVQREMLQSLRHPVVWGGYATLTEAARNGVLDCEPVYLSHLAGQLYDRFLGRCRVRKRWRDGLMLERVLPEVARFLVGHPPYSQDSWDQGCASCLGPPEARDLYNESMSYGLIERDAGRSWRWRHPFLVEYIASLGGGDT